MRQGERPAGDRLPVRGTHLRDIVNEKELGEVKVNAGALQVLAGAQELAARERLASGLLVQRGAARPGLAPRVPRGERGRDLLKVGERYAVGEEARRPMRDRGPHAFVLRHGGSSALPTGCADVGQRARRWFPIDLQPPPSSPA